MSSDLLPEWLNLFLDDVETTLCLPILIVMVVCTAQFIINYAMDIGLLVYQNLMEKSDDEDGEIDKESSENLMHRIKDFVCNLTHKLRGCDSKKEETAVPSPSRPIPHEEEWDYCEDDDN